MQRMWKISLRPIRTGKLIKTFPRVSKFFSRDINKFILLLQKDVYLYEYMDSWERFNEESLLDKKAFYRKSYLKGITDKDYAHSQIVWEVFEIKNLGQYHDLYVQSNTLLLVDAFENFRDKYIEIYELQPAHFLSPPALVWQAWLKKTKVKLELLANYNMLLMVEEGILGGIC